MVKNASLLVALMFALGCGKTEGPQGPRGLSGPTGMKGEKGDPGPGFTAPPEISGVSPRVVVPGQSLEITISGNATEWTGSTVVNFGDGIMVTKTVCPSPVALVVSIEVDKAAVPGDRDITINANGKMAIWKGAFRINELTKAEVFGR